MRILSYRLAHHLPDLQLADHFLEAPDHLLVQSDNWVTKPCRTAPQQSKALSLLPEAPLLHHHLHTIYVVPTG
jgi:hypothetical protein